MNNPTPNSVKKRIIIGFLVICLTTLGLSVRVGWVQIVNGEEYSKKAIESQTRDVPIPAKRGVIYDRNGKELAVSAVTFSVWARPDKVRNGSKKFTSEENIDRTAEYLASQLQMEKSQVKDIISQNKALVKVAKYVEKSVADTIRQEGLPGIEIAEDVKRYYPLGPFAAQVLGSVTDDNNGLAGLELKYNQYLSGVAGRWIKNTDVNGNSLAYGMEKYYKAEDGLNLVLTIDEVIQHYVEKALDTVQSNTMADRVMCIIMDPKTGDVLAMALTPDYDPNNPRVPTDPQKAAYVEGLSDSEKLEYWNSMWRNPMVSDTYEPGSTFKLLTTSMALEEQLTNLTETFVCKGRYSIAGTPLKCWRYYNPHGVETLVEAVGNSCNPVFAELSSRLGIEKYYQYLELFGIRDKTGIDYPGEGYAILQNKETAGPVGLATISYGQGIAVTPIQLITAVASFGNDGKLMQPRLVKELTDSDGNVVEKFDTKVVRQVVSKKTAEEMRLIMESVVSEGGGGTAKVPGFRVGGKTGTANKAKNGGYSEETYSSFIGMAPMDDPKVAILLIVDNPKGIKFGSQTAAPGVKLILEDTLRYLNIQPSYTQEEEAQMSSGKTVVPDVTGKNFDEAIGILGGMSLTYTISPALQDGESLGESAVVDQYPKAGEKISAGGKVYLYRE
ncbi:penicillin-binding transpeptidase domain-containing protein [Aminipila sp.]|uniref:penicillin-binding transpeptidase domain-containing protein n=1 Tax=Aminipila sp. TaxID=2060095 RepID=UPI001D6C2388|nr:penicillin-binding transpeptidase domain-containing protein [Aminipila sp.]MBE6035188.1 PASTA domain-containing protein [Clostridiales bacterium]